MTADVQDRGATATEASAVPARRRRRVPEWLVAVGVAVAVWAVAAIAHAQSRYFYYNGDQYDQNMPLWHLLGQRLRDGHWPVSLDPAGWMGGNNAAEALIGIWNPAVLGNYVLVSWFDDLTTAAFVVSAEFMGLLGIAVYLLARGYGAARWPSVAVGVALPFSGFTLFYEAGGWPYHLMGFTWVTWFWWAAHRHTQGRLNPLFAVVFGALAMTTGSPYGAAGVCVVLVALAVEQLVHREWGRLLHLVVVGACVGAVALLVYLPLLASNDVSWRAGLAGLDNDTWMVPDLGDLAGSSSPSYLPSITQWSGAVEVKPSTYGAWFVLPLLPWLRWGLVRSRLRTLTTPLVVGAVFLVGTLGPSNMWLFRWPIRFIDYLYLAGAVLVAVALSPGLGVTAPRRRALASAGIVAGGVYLAWSSQPAGLGGTHLLALLLVGVLVAAAVAAHRRRGLPGLGAVLVVGTAAVLTLQSSTFPYQPERDTSLPPYDVSALQAGAQDYEGTVLQLAKWWFVPTEQMRDGQFLWGNMQRLVGHETLGSYTGIGFSDFADELCMNYRGETCARAYTRLFQPTGAGVDAPLIDSLRVSTLVIQRSLVPDVAAGPPPAGWRVAETSRARVVWVREDPLPSAGRVSWTSPAVEVTRDDSTAQQETVRYRAGSAGQVLFARLDWPGYRATVDGQPVRLREAPAGLVLADVPAGQHELTLTYDPPGQRPAGAAVAVAGLAALLQAAVFAWQRSRRRRSGDAPVAPAPVAGPPDDEVRAPNTVEPQYELREV